MNQKNNILFRLVAFILLSIPFWGFAQQFQFNNHSVQQGLPQSQVYCIEQDKKGYLWFGTLGGGLCRFDGHDFEVFTTKQGLLNNFITDIQFYKDTLWIASYKGLCYYAQGEFGTSTRFNKLAGLKVNSMLFKSGFSSFATDQSTYLLKDRGELESLNQVLGYDKLYCAKVYSADSNTLWIGTSKGLIKYGIQSKEVTKYGKKEGLPLSDVYSIAKLNESTYLLGTFGAGVYPLKKGKIGARLAATNGLIVHDIFVDQSIWIATQNKGVIRLDTLEQGAQVLSSSLGLANNHVRTIYKDYWGSYWFGTSGGGLSKFSGQSFKHFTKKSGLPGNYIYSLFQDNKKQVWMGVSNGSIVRKDSTGFNTFILDTGLVLPKVKAITQSKDGKMWFGTQGKGVFVYDTALSEMFNAKNGLGGNYVFDMHAWGADVWVALLDGGISRITKRQGDYKIKRFTTNNGLSENRIYTLCRDQKGKIWYGTRNNGIGYIEGDSVVSLGSILGNWSVRSIKKGTKGVIWCATSEGLYQVVLTKNKVKAVLMNEKESSISQNIYSLLIDGSKIYAGAQNGLDEIVLNDQNEVIEFTHFGYDDGFIGVECSQGSAIKDAEGNLWFGTVMGVSKLSPNTQFNRSEVPLISFESVKVLYKPVLINSEQKLILDYDENNIGFTFKSIHLKKSKGAMYSFLLEGNNKEWSVADLSNNVNFSNLKPGKYTFRVKARFTNTKWSEPIEYSFEIKSPIWKKWWFVLLTIFLIGALVYWTYTNRLNNVRSKAQKEKERVQMQNELLSLEQKALQLQMNPHFLFNALNSIQSQIVNNNNKEARYNLSKFAHLMRQILENSSHSLITLEEEMSALENYLRLEQLTRSATFEYEINIQEEVESDETMIPPMLIQPFVENAIIHGFSGIDYQGKIDILVKSQGDYLLIQVTDNGIGRTKSSEKSRKGINRKSVGISITKKRLEVLNGSTKTIEIEDLIDAEQKESGTSVKIYIRTDE